MLPESDFLQLVDHGPLVSIDLVVVRGGREVLLGQRNNRPAQGFWFVPGGRIYKNERLQDAMARVVGSELGLPHALPQGVLVPRLMRAYEHFYPDSFAGDVGVSTHYVVLGHWVDVPDGFALPTVDAQHNAWRWWSVAEALASDHVHQHTKDYLTESSRL